MSKPDGEVTRRRRRAQERARKNPGKRPRSVRRRMVAVVGDDLEMRRALARLLSAFGFRTELFPSAEEFLHGAETSKACCLLVDVQPGGLSGLELVHELSTGGFKRPIIVISAVENELTVSLGA